jgi:hypothetical protein
MAGRQSAQVVIECCDMTAAGFGEGRCHGMPAEILPGAIKFRVNEVELS